MTGGRTHDLARAETLVTDDGHAPPSSAGIDASTARNDDDPGLALTRSAAPSGAEADAPPPARRNGRYVILARLGEGAMGEVFSGYDRELDRRIALKLLRSRRADDPLSRARMQREAQALAKLSHPNVVQVHDVGQLDDQLFVAMEYVAGETLEAWQARHDPTTTAGRRALLDMYMQAGRGLAAAHAAGIVHRDFKPSNVLVGDDGRARVLDFGLAAAARAASEPAAASDPDDDLLAPSLTRTGSVLGTPAYMAPEQFLAGTVDARTDVFAFSVALHEALYRVTPFEGQSFAARERSVVAGVVREVPATALPAWLRAVIARGLAREPADRHPSMEAMLAALAADPIARRRQRWRLFGLGLAALAVASLVLSVGLWGWRRWQQRQTEALAAERLAAVDARIDSALAAGAVDEAAQALAAFVESPDNRDTAALGQAWLHAAERARARGDTPQAVDALAGAYMLATRPADQAVARVGLARIFRDELQWRGLHLALASLTDTADPTIDPAELHDLRLDDELARRDLGGALARLRGPLAGSPRAALAPVLAALARASPTPHHHRGTAVLADLDGDGKREIVLATDARERQLAPLLRAEPGLPQIATLDLGAGNFRALAPGPGEPDLLVTSEPDASSPMGSYATVLRRWRAGSLEEVFRWREDGIISTLSADLDGDGKRELLVGSGPFSRGATELLPGPDGAWSTRPSVPDIDRRHSDVVALLADDLDGDGRNEVVAGLGPWVAYEIEVLRHDPASDRLRMLARHRLGNIAGVALVRRDSAGSGPEIVVSKTDEYAGHDSFPVDRPFGDPAGVYLLRLVDERLVQTAFVPAPQLPAGGKVLHAAPLVGDLDGDGRQELVIRLGIKHSELADERDATLVLVDVGDGALRPIVLGNLRPITVLDLDGDGDDELVASDSRADDHDRVWVLGSGDAAPPIDALDLTEQAAESPASDPVLARMWRHADELARMGLVRQSAERLVALSHQIADPELRARALFQAGELHDLRDDDVRAGDLFARAAAAPGLALTAHGAAARAFLRLARIADAVTHLEAARAVGEPSPAVAAAITALRGEPGVDLDFTAPLAPIWRVRQPLALRRDGARGALHVDAIDNGELLSAPIRVTGSSLTLAIDIDLTRVEWNSGLELGLVRANTGLADDTSPLGVDITTTGGGDERVLEIACMSGGRRSVARFPFRKRERLPLLGPLTIRATLLPEIGEWTCKIDRPGGESLFYTRNHLPAPLGDAATLRLTLASTRHRSEWVAATIDRIVLTGAGVDPDAAPDEDPPALVAAGRATVEDDPLAVLAALDPVPELAPIDRLLVVVALARLGRLGEAERAMLRVTSQPPTMDLLLRIIALMRREPVLFGGLVRAAAGPAEFRGVLASAAGPSLIMEQDPRTVDAMWTGLADRDLDTDEFRILKYHGLAAATLGHVDAARTSYRAAVVALADPARVRGLIDPGLLDSEALELHFQLAILALAAGDLEAARQELLPYAEAADPDPRFADRLLACEELRPLWPLASRPQTRGK